MKPVDYSRPADSHIKTPVTKLGPGPWYDTSVPLRLYILRFMGYHWSVRQLISDVGRLPPRTDSRRIVRRCETRVRVMCVTACVLMYDTYYK